MVGGGSCGNFGLTDFVRLCILGLLGFGFVSQLEDFKYYRFGISYTFRYYVPSGNLTYIGNHHILTVNPHKSSVDGSLSI